MSGFSSNLSVFVPFRVILITPAPVRYDMPEKGKPGRKPRVTDEEILQLFQEAEDPVLSTAEVTEQLPIKRSATYKRLVSLREEERLTGKEIGGRNSIWWIPGN